MTGGLFLCSIATCPPLPLPPFYAATLIPMHPSYATIVLISFTLLLFWCCHPSYHAILLMLPPFWCPLPCHLLPLPSLWCCHLLTLHPSYNAILLVPFTLPSFWCPLIISTAELRSFVGSVNLTSVACSSGSPDKPYGEENLSFMKFTDASNHPECILMLKGILMSKQVPAFLKVQLCGLEVLLAWVDALSLTKFCRERALWKFGLLIISHLQNGMHFLNCRNYFILR